METDIRPLGFDAVRLVRRPTIYISESNWRWRTVIPDYCNLWLLLRGRGTLVCDGRTHRLAPGMAFVFTPGQRVDAWHDPESPLENFAAHFRPMRQGRLCRQPRGFPIAAIEMDTSLFMREAARHAAQVSALDDPFAERQAEGIVYQMLACVWRCSQTPSLPPRDRQIIELVEQIRRRPSMRPSVREMAARTGLSPSHFERRFSALVGDSPTRWLVQVRIARARELLRSSPLGVGEIAEALGYADIHFFSRQFKQRTGLSPLQFRSRT